MYSTVNQSQLPQALAFFRHLWRHFAAHFTVAPGNHAAVRAEGTEGGASAQ